MKKSALHYDVAVIGGGLGGVAAAVHAKRGGAERVLIVEQTEQFGGIATNGLITTFSQEPLPGKTFYQEIKDRLADMDMLNGNRFSGDALSLILDELVQNENIDVLFATVMTAVHADSRKVESVTLLNRTRQIELNADIFIDATGDGDVCSFAGAEFEIGVNNTGRCQPMTVGFYMVGCDFDRFPPRAEINNRYDIAKAEGRIENPRENVLFFETVWPGTILFNTTRIVGYDPTDDVERTLAIMEGRRQIRQMVEFLQTIPGMESAKLGRIGSTLGVRESRRIVCDYMLTEDDMNSGRTFYDAIVATDAHVDIHNPYGSGTRFDNLPDGVESYQIPFRVLIPRDLDNVLIASRCFGSSHEAHSATRMMGHVLEYGRAAGFAAAWCSINGKTNVRQTDIDWLVQSMNMESYTVKTCS